MHLPDPVPELKRLLGRELQGVIAGWETPELCHMLGTTQPRVSNLRKGRLERFSLEMLVRYLARMRRDVTVSVRERRISFRRDGGGTETRGSCRDWHG
jgi:hypothetical protein